MSFRSFMLIILLGVVLLFAGLLKLDWSLWWMKPLYVLNHFELFHIVAHSCIFAGVVFLYDPQQKGDFRLWVIVLTGGILIEVVQFTTSGGTLTRRLLFGSLYDLMIDTLGAVAAWWWLMRSPGRHTHPETR